MEQEAAASFDRGQSTPLQPKGADPEWLPASTLMRASSEGGEANQGRCKCGEASLSWLWWTGLTKEHIGPLCMPARRSSQHMQSM